MENVALRGCQEGLMSKGVDVKRGLALIDKTYRLDIATGSATKVANTPEIHVQQQRPQLAVFRHRLYRTTSTFQPSAFDSHV